MKNTPFYKEKTTLCSFDESIVKSAKVAVKNNHFIFPELMLCHLFLTKEYPHHWLNKSFPAITNPNKLVDCCGFSKQNQLSITKNTLMLILYIDQSRSVASEGYSDILKFFGSENFLGKNKGHNLNFSYEHNNEIEKKAYYLNQYLCRNLCLSKEEIQLLMAKIGSFLISLYQEKHNYTKFEYFHSLSIYDFPWKKLKNTRLNPALDLYRRIVSSKKPCHEINILNSFQLVKKEKALRMKSESLKYHYIERQRVYHKLIWEKKYKPKDLHFCHGFYQNLYSLFSCIKPYAVKYTLYNDFSVNYWLNHYDLFLICISLEQIFNQKVLKSQSI